MGDLHGWHDVKGQLFGYIVLEADPTVSRFVGWTEDQFILTENVHLQRNGSIVSERERRFMLSEAIHNQLRPCIDDRHLDRVDGLEGCMR